jgi:hypothetical protein
MPVPEPEFTGRLAVIVRSIYLPVELVNVPVDTVPVEDEVVRVELFMGVGVFISGAIVAIFFSLLYFFVYNY